MKKKVNRLMLQIFTVIFCFLYLSPSGSKDPRDIIDSSCCDKNLIPGAHECGETVINNIASAIKNAQSKYNELDLEKDRKSCVGTKISNLNMKIKCEKNNQGGCGVLTYLEPITGKIIVEHLKGHTEKGGTTITLCERAVVPSQAKSLGIYLDEVILHETIHLCQPKNLHDHCAEAEANEGTYPLYKNPKTKELMKYYRLLCPKSEIIVTPK